MQGISKRTTSNKTKHLLVENGLKKLKTFDLSYFKGKDHFEEEGAQEFQSGSINDCLMIVLKPLANLIIFLILY